MAKSKLTPQEIYRQRRQREEWEKTAYLPPGLINHGNTCFMNSVLQGLLATRLLADLVYFNPILPELQRHTAGLIVSTRSPQLMNGHGFAGRHKLPYVSGMPIGDAFLDTLDKAWIAQANRRKEVLSPRVLLATMGRKYDQYLDFAQQDAHEFLRILLDAMRMEEFDIIKIRQPPPPPKKKRRTTITPENARDGLRAQNGVPLKGVSPALKDLPPAPSSPPTSAADLPLMSFVDMIFGGQLTSILVCQKCKHVSQTYEDFNDISLSLKPEDYANRKRDRFRRIVGRLTNFPSSTFNNMQTREKPILSSFPPANTVEMLRSSSVPPTPSKEKQRSLPGGGLEGPPIEASRRRSLDVSVESLLQDGTVDAADRSTPTVVAHSQDKAGEVKAKEVDEDSGMVSDGSHIIVNVTGPEGRHVEFVEPKRKKEESQSDQSVVDVRDKKQPEEAPWSRFGRRISLNLGLGRQKDKKERERKARSMDRAPQNAGSIKEDDPEEAAIIVNPVSTTEAHSKSKASPYDPTHNAEAPQYLSPQPIPSSLKRDHSPTRDSGKDHASNTAPKFPTIQRSRSPKPPKPSAAETEYLRRVLADVSFPSGNPFALLRPPLLHDPTSGGPSEKEKVAGPAWLGLGSRTFSGIEECLRMFTAVEVLDGENMVGCRRCWKIQNGVFQSKKDDSDEEEEDEGSEGPISIPGAPSQLNASENLKPPSLVVPPTLNIIASPTSPSSPIHFQASQSTPTVSYYAQRESHSISSLPTSLSDANLSLLKDKGVDSSDSALSLSVVSERSEYSQESANDLANQPQGPGGLPIPFISTTAPVDVPSTSSSTPSDSGSESHYSSAPEGKDSSLPGSIEELNRRAAYAQLTRGILNSNGRGLPSSTSSLMIPPRGTRVNRRKLPSETTTDEGSSEDESDESTSVSAESGIDVVQPPTGTEKPFPQPTQGHIERPQKKVSKPKPVIMRPAYKRYLIATPPPVLVIHLKRFQQTLKAPLMLSFSNGFKKLDDYVSFPEYLDLSPFLAPRKEDYGLGKKRKEKEVKKKGSPREERCMYRLYGVVVHIGNMLGGHYIAYTALPNEAPRHRYPDKSSEPSGTVARGRADDEKRNVTNPDSETQRAPARERQWAYISDTHVRLTTLEEVLNSKAYICMYERC